MREIYVRRTIKLMKYIKEEINKWRSIPCSRTTSTLLNTPKPLTVCIITNCGKFFKR